VGNWIGTASLPESATYGRSASRSWSCDTAALETGPTCA